MLVLELPTPQWIIWNVGQGQWVTQVRHDQCWHFDFGGEINPIKAVERYCSWRQNILLLSHADRDHFNFLISMRKKFKNICLLGPSWKKLPLQKVQAHNLPSCDSAPNAALEFFLPSVRATKDDNLGSQIVEWDDWLIPGDAPKSAEKSWLKVDQAHSEVKKLLLGHHGSKTSTSLELLMDLPQLLQCISSSRKKKYGHPHREVRNRIKTFCSLVLTEDWNHLHFLESAVPYTISN
jgi:competence protein ComEC